MKRPIAIALTGSYCCYGKAFEAIEKLAETYDITAIMSETAGDTDSRFGLATEHIKRLEALTGRSVLRSIVEAEPIGPEGRYDILVIAPCTGNTAAKLALGVTDTAVTMAAKSQLRGGRPVLLAFGSNDGLGASAKNIGELLVRRDVYFAPMYQDDPAAKPRSLATDYDKLPEAIAAALEGRQYQPIFTGNQK